MSTSSLSPLTRALRYAGLLLLCSFFTQCVFAESVFVEVQSAKLRKEPKAWAAPIADVSFGDKIEVLEKNDQWLKVKTAKNAEGYLHLTAVTARPVILKGSTQATLKLDSAEAVLAGKGFGSDTAMNYEKSHAEINFALVDAMENQSHLSDALVVGFMKAGNLNVSTLQ